MVLKRVRRRCARMPAAVLPLLLALAACSSTPKDEFANTPVEKLYADAKEDMSSGGYERAIKQLERVEGGV